MNSPSKFLSSLAALSLLTTTPACVGPETSESVEAVASVSQAATVLTVTIDGDATLYENMTARINGRDASLDEVAKALGDMSAPSKELRATLDGKETPVKGATGTLTAKTLSIVGFKPVTEVTVSAVSIMGVYSTGDTVIELRFVQQRTRDANENEALATAQQMNELIQNLVKRYPDLEKQNPDEFERKEAAQLEKIATLYCQASGKGSPCEPTANEGDTKPKRLGNWFSWVTDFMLAVNGVGVIPHETTCPSGADLVQIYHDDEDNRNANTRWGWLGGTVSNSNTLFRFCRVPGRGFYSLPNSGTPYNYAVLKLGAFCPSTSRTVLRYFDNEDRNNSNSGSGPRLPNINILGRGWLMHFCVFTGGSTPMMSNFPNIGFSYGVFAPTNMPAPYSLQAGYLYKDDEDTFNLNSWVPGPDSMMGGGNNTWMGLARVK